MSQDIQVRALKRHEVDLHKELRLKALRDEPDVFGQSFEDAASRDTGYWEQLTESVTAVDQHIMLLSIVEEVVCGSVYGLLDRTRADGVRVGGMWVDPLYRKRGVGMSLLRELFQWALKQERSHVGLWVPAHKKGAVALYKRAGFVETGACKPHPSQVEVQVVAMEKNL